jgi:restriction system protein
MVTDPMKLTADEFEDYVRRWLKRQGKGFSSLTVMGKQTLEGPDGEFEIDAHAKFEALGAEFLVLVECKRHKKPVSRDMVLALKGKLAALAAHKGMMFSTSGFQSGALEFAQAQGLATFHVMKGSTVRLSKAEGTPPSDSEIVAWRIEPGDIQSLLDPLNKDVLEDFFI